MACRPQGHKESDTAEGLTLSLATWKEALCIKPFISLHYPIVHADTGRRQSSCPSRKGVGRNVCALWTVEQ